MSKACGRNGSVYGSLKVGLVVSIAILVGTMGSVCTGYVISLICKGYECESSGVVTPCLMISCVISLLHKSIGAPCSSSRITLESCLFSGDVCLGDENPGDGLACDNGM